MLPVQYFKELRCEMAEGIKLISVLTDGCLRQEPEAETSILNARGGIVRQC